MKVPVRRPATYDDIVVVVVAGASLRPELRERVVTGGLRAA